MYVAVITGNREDNPNYPPNGKSEFEPIITAGYFDYGKTAPKNIDGWRCRWHVYTEDSKYDGTIFELDQSGHGWKPREKNIKALRSMALPLPAIREQDDLNKSVIEPVINDFQNYITGNR